MWIVKGVLLGILFFVVGGTAYLWIRIRIGMYLYTQAVRAGRPTHGILPYYESTQLLHDPRFWITLLAAIAIGLWIMRARTTHTV